MPVIVATASGSEPQPGKDAVQVVRVADVSRTANQVGILLNVLGASIQMLRADTDVEAHAELDKESQDEARKTYSLAHLRLRDIIDDQERWTRHDDMSEPFRVLNEGQANLAKAQQAVEQERVETMKELRRPSRIYGAQLVQTAIDGAGTLGWVAFIGPAPRQDGMLGIGLTPEQAFADFDRNFTAPIPAPAPAEPPPAPAEDPFPETPAPKKRGISRRRKK